MSTATSFSDHTARTLEVLLRAGEQAPFDWMKVAATALARKHTRHPDTGNLWTATTILPWVQKHGRDLAAAVAQKYKTRLVPERTLYEDIINLREHEHLTYPQIADRLTGSKVISDRWFAPHPCWSRKTVTSLVSRVSRRIPKGQVTMPLVLHFDPKSCASTASGSVRVSPAVLSENIVQQALGNSKDEALEQAIAKLQARKKPSGVATLLNACRELEKSWEQTADIKEFVFAARKVILAARGI
jgi:hypothetical protein